MKWWPWRRAARQRVAAPATGPRDAARPAGAWRSLPPLPATLPRHAPLTIPAAGPSVLDRLTLPEPTLSRRGDQVGRVFGLVTAVADDGPTVRDGDRARLPVHRRGGTADWSGEDELPPGEVVPAEVDTEPRALPARVGSVPEAPLAVAAPRWVAPPAAPATPWTPSEFLHRAYTEKDRLLAQTYLETNGEAQPRPRTVTMPETDVEDAVPPPAPVSAPPKGVPARRASLAQARRQGLTPRVPPHEVRAPDVLGEHEPPDPETSRPETSWTQEQEAGHDAPAAGQEGGAEALPALEDARLGAETSGVRPDVGVDARLAAGLEVADETAPALEDARLTAGQEVAGGAPGVRPVVGEDAWLAAAPEVGGETLPARREPWDDMRLAAGQEDAGEALRPGAREDSRLAAGHEPIRPETPEDARLGDGREPMRVSPETSEDPRSGAGHVPLPVRPVVREDARPAAGHVPLRVRPEASADARPAAGQEVGGEALRPGAREDPRLAAGHEAGREPMREPPEASEDPRLVAGREPMRVPPESLRSVAGRERMRPEASEDARLAPGQDVDREALRPGDPWLAAGRDPMRGSPEDGREAGREPLRVWPEASEDARLAAGRDPMRGSPEDGREAGREPLREPPEASEDPRLVAGREPMRGSPEDPRSAGREAGREPLRVWPETPGDPRLVAGRDVDREALRPGDPWLVAGREPLRVRPEAPGDPRLAAGQDGGREALRPVVREDPRPAAGRVPMRPDAVEDAWLVAGQEALRPGEPRQEPLPVRREAARSESASKVLSERGPEPSDRVAPGGQVVDDVAGAAPDGMPGDARSDGAAHGRRTPVAGTSDRSAAPVGPATVERVAAVSGTRTLPLADTAVRRLAPAGTGADARGRVDTGPVPSLVPSSRAQFATGDGALAGESGSDGPGVVEERAPLSVVRPVALAVGVDVSDVTVRRGRDVTAMSHRLGARGYTDDRVVYLPDDVGSIDGTSAAPLLAHELTHAAQQREFGLALPDPGSFTGMQLEEDAVEVERWVAGGAVGAPPTLTHPVGRARQQADAAPTDTPGGDGGRYRVEDVLSAFSATALNRPNLGVNEIFSEFDPETGRSRIPAEAYGMPALDVSSMFGSEPFDVTAGSDGPGGGKAGGDAKPAGEAEFDEGTVAKLAEAIADLFADEPPRRWFDLDDVDDFEELAGRIHNELMSRLRLDMVVDRERSGTLLDFG